MKPFSDRIEKIKPSATLKARLKAQELQGQGFKVIDFSAGEPDFHTPTPIKEACKKAIDKNWTRYAPIPGLLELREAIAGKLKRISGVDCNPNHIVVTCGAKQAIFSSLQVLLNPDDEVLIPAPYWVTYPEQVLLVDAKPVFLPTDESTQFKITPKQLEKAIRPKTKLLILNSPSNPTGACYTKEEYEAIGKICLDKKIWVLSDEIYEELVYDDFKQVSFLKASPKNRERTILINGASKAYAMTGWRMGYALGPSEFIEKLKTFQSQDITSIPTFIQRACITAFSDCDAEVAQMRKEFVKRRDLLYQKLTAIQGLQCAKPQGAFYIFPNLKSFKLGQNPADFLLEKAHVVVVDGEGFGAPGYIRISFATDKATLEEGAKRIKEALEK